MKPPAGLGKAGRKLWTDVQHGLGDGWELNERETHLLELAAGQRDNLDLLEAAIRDQGSMVRGSRDQMVLNPAIAEARQCRLAIGRLLGQIGLAGEDDEKPETDKTRRARRAARARWDRKDKVVQMREDRNAS